jgi:prephenate dehydratase
MKIAIQGEPGSFSHQATLRVVPDAEIVPCALSADVFEQLRTGTADAIMIPIENTLAGSVVEHYDLLRAGDLFIEREAVIRIEHNLIGIPGSRLEEIRRVYSHPIALAQCRRFFREHPSMEPVAFYDTAGAVKQVMEQGDRTTGAIAGRHAATIYGGALLVQNVEDDAKNFTRFLLVRAGTAASHPEGAHKLSLCCRVAHRPGTLAQVLSEVAAASGNLVHIQSRPVEGHPWHYYVFMDILMPEARVTDRLLDTMQALGSESRVLGRFVAAPEFSAL